MYIIKNTHGYYLTDGSNDELWLDDVDRAHRFALADLPRSIDGAGLGLFVRNGTAYESAHVGKVLAVAIPAPPVEAPAAEPEPPPELSDYLRTRIGDFREEADDVHNYVAPYHDSARSHRAGYLQALDVVENAIRTFEVIIVPRTSMKQGES